MKRYAIYFYMLKPKLPDLRVDWEKGETATDAVKRLTAKYIKLGYKIEIRSVEEELQ